MKALVTTDGSEFSLKALGMLGTLLSTEKTEVELVSVYASPRALTYGADPFNVSFERMSEQLRDKAESDVDEGRRVLEEQGFKVKTLTVMGDAATAILTLAEKGRYDLIVVGSHGRTGLQRFLLGSVSERVVRYAPCSTLVVKLPRESSRG